MKITSISASSPIFDRFLQRAENIVFLYIRIDLPFGK
jgi:hypothetical protein